MQQQQQQLTLFYPQLQSGHSRWSGNVSVIDSAVTPPSRCLPTSTVRRRNPATSTTAVPLHKQQTRPGLQRHPGTADKSVPVQLHCRQSAHQLSMSNDRCRVQESGWLQLPDEPRVHVFQATGQPNSAPLTSSLAPMNCPNISSITDVDRFHLDKRDQVPSIHCRFTYLAGLTVRFTVTSALRVPHIGD